MPETDPVTDEQQQYIERQRVEYGTFVANAPIYHNGALAYGTDHAVPVSNVEKFGYEADGLVRRVGEDRPAAPEQPAPVQGADIEIVPAAVTQESGEEAAVEHDPEPSIVPDLTKTRDASTDK